MPNGRRFRPRPEPEGGFEDHLVRSLQTASWQQRYRVRLLAPAEVIRGRAPAAVEVEPDGDDACVVTVGSDDVAMVAKYLAWWDAPFEVLDSPELLAEVQLLARRYAAAAQRPPGGAPGNGRGRTPSPTRRETRLTASRGAPPNGSVTPPRTVVLVEGNSDRVALQALAGRQGRDLAADGVDVIPMHGVTNTRAFASRYGPGGLGIPLAGLYDLPAEAILQRGLAAAGLPRPSSPTARPGSGSSPAPPTSRTSSCGRSARRPSRR